MCMLPLRNLGAIHYRLTRKPQALSECNDTCLFHAIFTGISHEQSLLVCVHYNKKLPATPKTWQQSVFTIQGGGLNESSSRLGSHSDNKASSTIL